MSAVDAPARDRDWLYLALSVVGPIVLTFAYVVFEILRPADTFAPGQGAASATRWMLRFTLYGAALLAFVVVGTMRCRRDGVKVAFALLAIGTSLAGMFFAFVGQLAG